MINITQTIKKTFSIAMLFVIACVFIQPQKAEAAEVLEFAPFLTAATKDISDVGAVWNASSAITGVSGQGEFESDDWDGTQYHEFLKNSSNATDRANADAIAQDTHNRLGNAFAEYQGAYLKNRSNNPSMGGDGIIADSYTKYKINDPAALKDLADKAAAVGNILKGMQAKGFIATDTEDGYGNNFQYTAADINQIFATAEGIQQAAANGTLVAGGEYQVHQRGNVDGIKGSAVKVFGKNGESAVINQGSQTIQCWLGIPNGIDIPGCLAIGSYYILLKPASWMLWVAGIIFNIGLNFTLNFGAILNDKSLGLGSDTGAIFIGWSTIRNFVNVAFIFVLLYVSIATIVQLDGYNAKKMITKIVIAALFINFSLFFTKAIIDLSNLVALQFYSRILAASAEYTGTSGDADSSGISVGFLNALSLNTIWGGKGSTTGGPATGDYNSLQLDPYQLLLISIMGSAFILIFAFTLIMATIQFLIRSLILIVLMITSPIGFLQGSIPGLDSNAKEWWGHLKQNAIFAPVYMALLYMVSQIIFGASRDAFSSAEGFRSIVKNDSNGLGIVFWFALVIGLLLAAQMTAGKFASKFGSGYTKAASGFIKDKAKKIGKKVYVDAPRAALNATVGEAGRRVMNRTGAGDTINRLNMAARRAVFNKTGATAAGQRRLEAAKADAKALRRGRDEEEVDYKKRQNTIINRAQLAAWNNEGFKAVEGEHYKIGSKGEIILEDKGKKEIEKLRLKASKMYGKGRRKAAQDRLDTTFGSEKPKKGTVEEAERKLEGLEKAKEEIENDALYKTVRDQYKSEVDTIETRINGHIAAGTAIPDIDIHQLAEARRKLGKHTAKFDKLVEDIDKQKEKVEDAKRREADKKK